MTHANDDGENSALAANTSSSGVEGALISNKDMVEKYMFQQTILTAQVFRCLMIMSDFLVCIAHGSNDVGNAISPCIVLMDIDHQPSWISFFVGGMGIAAGLFIYGERVMITIGKDIIKLDYMKGFSSQFSAAISVCLGSSLGLPLSTTHCIVGAIGGTHITTQMGYVRNVYIRDKNAKMTEEEKAQVMSLKTLKKIVFGWLITIPVAYGASAGLTYLLIHVF